MAMFWGYFFQGVVPDTYDIIGAIIASIGTTIIFYYPRKGREKLESTHPTDYSFILVLFTFGLFVVAALLDIGGGYLVWQWLREKRKPIFGLIGGFILLLYGIIPTIQPSNFGRVYAAYGGIFVVMAIVWGLVVEKKDLISMK